MDYFAPLDFASGFHVNPANFMLDLTNGTEEVTEDKKLKKVYLLSI
jgi:hypothetical protein